MTFDFYSVNCLVCSMNLWKIHMDRRSKLYRQRTEITMSVCLQSQFEDYCISLSLCPGHEVRDWSSGDFRKRRGHKYWMVKTPINTTTDRFYSNNRNSVSLWPRRTLPKLSLRYVIRSNMVGHVNSGQEVLIYYCMRSFKILVYETFRY
jgi:hypothetical protein